MKLKFFLLLVALSVVSSHPAWARKLPDACGDDKVKFDLKLQKDPPSPPPPVESRSQIFFVESSQKPMALGCMGRCGNFTRYGVDGTWVGATKDNSYFLLSLDPGVHHLCAVQGKSIYAEALTVEAGKAYYFQVNYNAEGTQYGDAQHPNYQIKNHVDFALLSEDKGKYLVKVSELSTASMK
jgi:hypothetical protein